MLRLVSATFRLDGQQTGWIYRTYPAVSVKVQACQAQPNLTMRARVGYMHVCFYFHLLQYASSRYISFECHLICMIRQRTVRGVVI